MVGIVLSASSNGLMVESCIKNSCYHEPSSLKILPHTASKINLFQLPSMIRHLNPSHIPSLVRYHLLCRPPIRLIVHFRPSIREVTTYSIAQKHNFEHRHTGIHKKSWTHNVVCGRVKRDTVTARRINVVTTDFGGCLTRCNSASTRAFAVVRILGTVCVRVARCIGAVRGDEVVTDWVIKVSEKQDHQETAQRLQLTTHVVVGTSDGETKSLALGGTDVSAIGVYTVEVSVEGTRIGVGSVDMAGRRVGGISSGASGCTLAFVKTLVAVVCQCCLTRQSRG
jgi:hypothetical protein